MAFNKSANAILSREWRLFKPLAWMVFTGVALLACVVGAGAVRGTPKPLSLVVLHADERASVEEVTVTPSNVAPDAPPTGRFVSGIRIELAENAAFSHPVTLNFPGSPKPGLEIFRRDGSSWVRVKNLDVLHSGVAATATTNSAGDYVLMDVGSQPPGSQ